jgi:hypothetical protein
MDITAGLTVNTLFWISSLRAGEEGPTRRVLENLEVECQRIGLPFKVYEPTSVPLLLDALEKIEEASRKGMRPIIHFDMHGSISKGLEIAAAKESGSWPVVVERLKAINIATKNNLCVVSGACFGLHAIKEVTITEPCPFYILIAPEHEVSFGFLEDHTAAFYAEVFSSADIMKAYESHLAEQMKVFHCEKMLAVALARYIRKSCRGQGGKQRRERLISEIFMQGRERTPENLREVRWQLKAGLRPTQDFVDRFAERFLIGKKCGFTLDDLMGVIERADAAETRTKARQRRKRSQVRTPSKPAA